MIVTREKSDNNYIKSLTVPQGVISPVFNKETFEYTMTLEAHIKRITPNIILESDAATYEIENNSNFKVGENIVTIKVTAENGDVRNYTIIVTKEGSDDNYLADLDITDQDLPFAKDILEYNVTYPNQTTRVEVTGVLNDTLSKVEGFGSYTLVSGNNDITVKVTSETGIDRNYIIHAFREYATDATLKDLITSKGQLSPEFDKDIKAYSFTVPYENDSIILDVIPNSDVAKVKLSSNEATIKDNPLTNNENDYVVNLQVDENIITILVTAEDNITEEIYTVTVNREKSGNTNLASLIIKEAALSPTFNKAKLNYTAKVPYQISDVNVLAIPEDSNSSVIIEGNTNLEVGENIITVTVTAPSGKVSVYSVTLTRKPYSTTILTLDSLETSVCDIDFDKDTLYYECTVEYPINKTDITATTENNDATILGTGTNLDLNVGINVFPVRVVVGNEELDYQVVINREKSDEYRLSNLDVTNGTMDKEFNQDDLEYNVTITDINPIIVFEKLDPNQTVEIINNDLEFITGETRDVLVKVTSPSLRKDRTYTLHVTKEISSNAYLKNLSVLGLNLSEAFDKERDTYHLTVNDSYTSIYIQATPEYKYATVFGIGTNLLKVGENIIPITVTAEDGVTKKIYNLVVTRIGSTDATLRGLRVNDYEISPEFNPNTTTYTVNVPYNVSTVTIEANPNNDEATIVGDGVQAVRRGKNTLTVTVTSGNGTIKNYTIIVNRDNPVTSLLDNIVVDNYSLDPEFKSKIYEYNVVIDNEVTELGLHVIPIDSKATWEIMGNENFKVGLNEVTILVTSSDGEEQTTYKLMVNRQPYTNTYLSGITVNSDLTFYDLMPEFDKDILSYTVYVPNEISTVTLQATAQNVSNTITGLGNKNLSVGENIFNIKVSTKGGISRTYTVNIIRNGSNNAFIKSLTSNIGKVTRTGDYTFELTVPKGTTAVSHDNFVATPIDPLATVSYQDFVDLSKANDFSIVITSKDQTVSKEYVVYIRYEKD